MAATIQALLDGACSLFKAQHPFHYLLSSEDLLETTRAHVKKNISAIGPDAVKSVWRNTIENSKLQEFTLQHLSESLVYNTNGRQIEDCTECFTAIDGFGPMHVRRFLGCQAHANAQVNF